MTKGIICINVGIIIFPVSGSGVIWRVDIDKIYAIFMRISQY